MKQSSGIRTFYTLLITQTLSYIGSQMSGLAVGLWIYERTGEASPLAFAAFFGILPRIVSTGLGGVFADRWSRRNIMMLTDFAQAIGSFLLLFSIVSGGFELWHLYVITMIQALFASFQGPAFDASVTMLVPEAQRNRANTIRQLTGPTSGVVAMAATGVVYAAIGVTGVIVIDLLTFVAAASVLIWLYIPQPEKTEEGIALGQAAVWKDAFVGLRYLASKQGLFILVIYISIINMLINGVGVLMIPYISARTGDPAMVGVLMAVFNAGAIVGGILFSIWGGPKQNIIPFILMTLVIAPLFLVAFGMFQVAFWMGLALFCFFLPLPMINSLFMSVMQVKVPPDLQGRVFAALNQMSMLITPVGYILVGPLVDSLLEPAVGTERWSVVAPLVGNETGAGMGFLYLSSGLLVSILSIIIYTIPSVRRIEHDMPDYVAKLPENNEFAEDNSATNYPDIDTSVSTDSVTTAPA